MMTAPIEAIPAASVLTVGAGDGPSWWGGDPSMIGWIICLSYLATAGLCLWAMRVARFGARLSRQWEARDRRSRDRSSAYRASVLFWLLLAVVFGLLGLNKQVDLQVWLTEMGRDIARWQGWYEQRRQVQLLFVAVVSTGGLAVLSVLLYFTRHLLPRHVPAFAGMMLLACFGVLRVSSFHDVEAVLAGGLAGLKLRHIAELAGIGCVAACAVMNCRWYARLARLRHRDGRSPLLAS